MSVQFVNRVSVQILPEALSFGCVCHGFVYQLVVTILNKGNRPQYFKVLCNYKEGMDAEEKINPLPKVIFEPRSVAPGLSISFTLEMRAEHAINSFYELSIVEGINRSTIRKEISAYIVPLEIFRQISKAAELQDRSVYRHGVKPVSTTLPIEEISLISGGGPNSVPPSIASIISEALMDENDIDELLELPMAPNMYWDPFEKSLKMDPELGTVIVDPSWTVEESQQQTKSMRDKRMTALEEKGFYTIRTIARFGEAKTTLTMGTMFSGLDQPSLRQNSTGYSQTLEELTMTESAAWGHNPEEEDPRGDFALPAIGKSGKR